MGYSLAPLRVFSELCGSMYVRTGRPRQAKLETTYDYFVAYYPPSSGRYRLARETQITLLLRTCEPSTASRSTSPRAPLGDDRISVLPLQTEEHSNEGDNSDGAHRPYAYRLFPDWRTPYLWYDPSAPDYHGDPAVEDYIPDARYPVLAPLYWAWHEFYEDAFEKQGCHMGSRAEAFPGRGERVGWNVVGSLIASLLVLQDVTGVEYSPDSVRRYLLTEVLDDVVKGFLDDENEILAAK